MNKLVELGKEVGDKEIIEGIHLFCGEVLINSLAKYGESYNEISNCLKIRNTKPKLVKTAKKKCLL